MNRVVHFEIHAKDMDAQQKFYTDVFGWNIQSAGPEYGGYRMIVTGAPMTAPDPQDPGINGGLTPRVGDIPKPESSEPVNAFVCTIGVENIDAIVNKVKNAGGSIALEKMDVPMVGKLAYCKDPEGNIFGVLQPVEMQADAQAEAAAEVDAEATVSTVIADIPTQAPQMS